MSRFASQTTVSVDRSRTELESLLLRYGATKFSYGFDSEAGMAVVQFTAQDRHVRFRLTMPLISDFESTDGARPRKRNEAEQRRAWEQACRQLWRALVLCIKAKLEAVASGITSFESEFMAQILLPSGETAGETYLPKIDADYRSSQKRLETKS